MIGTHNSLTCYSPKKWWFRPFKFLWKCQNKTLFEQLDDGVKYFDIRIRINKNKDICFCHGLVDIDCPFSLDYILYILEKNKAKCRIIIERGPTPELIFPKDPTDILDQIIIKKGWIVLGGHDNLFHIIDYCYVPWHSGWGFWKNIKNFKFSTIKKWARVHNPIISEELKESKDVHFMDYYNIKKS